jgi:protein-tyrosine phosphatase
MAAALLGLVVPDEAPAGSPAGLDEPVAVVSAGLLEGGHPVSPEVVKVMISFGVDLSGQLSTQLTADAVEGAELILGMERRHAREIVLLVPTALSRTFTVKEFVRRGEKVGPRLPGQPLALWLETVSDGRDRTDLIGRAPEEEVADPLGGVLADYRATAAELADLIGRMTRLLWPDGPGQIPVV